MVRIKKRVKQYYLLDATYFSGFLNVITTKNNNLVNWIDAISCRHLDAHHKLIRWRIVIHGAVDGYSRAILYLKASSNNYASTVLDLFESATVVFRYPRRIRTDYGTENVDVARKMLDRYGAESNPVLTGQSVHNALKACGGMCITALQEHFLFFGIQSPFGT